jgi:hypothetical protein
VGEIARKRRAAVAAGGGLDPCLTPEEEAELLTWARTMAGVRPTAEQPAALEAAAGSTSPDQAPYVAGPGGKVE